MQRKVAEGTTSVYPRELGVTTLAELDCAEPMDEEA
jgi:hypothetical protein